MSSTTIRIESEVRDDLRARGRMGESYNDVIRRLLAATPPSNWGRDDLGRRPSEISSRQLFLHGDRK